ncbi:MAG: PCRF domain-containing protein, partial [Clostridia bacterium]|nr:PCRF domain-containing protein [Clostridia bacterium]
MIVELEQYTQKLTALRDQLKEVGGGLHIDDMERELSELKEEMNADGFLDNLERSTYVNRRISNLEGKIKHYEGLLASCDDVETMMELAQEENDEDMIAEAGAEIDRLEAATESLTVETMMRGKYDDHNAI